MAIELRSDSEIDADPRVSNRSMCAVACAAPGGLLYYNVFGDPAVSPGRNLAPGRPPGRVYGAPTSNGIFTQLGPAGYIDTLIQDRDDLTIMAVAGMDAAGPGAGKYGYIAASYLSPTGIGTNMGAFPASAGNHVWSAIIGRFNSQQQPAIESTGAVSAYSFQMLAQRASSSYGTRFEMPKTGAVVENRTPPIGLRNLSIGNIYLGRAPRDEDIYGPVNVIAVAIWSRVLSDAEVAAASVQLRGLLTGIIDV